MLVFASLPLSTRAGVGIAPGSDPTVHCTNNPGTAHVCIKCGGQFTVALVATAGEAATANIDYVVLQPGQWGRVLGQNARKDVFDTLQTMGVKAIRLGGSFCSVTKDDGLYYQWQKWTGPVWERLDPPHAHVCGWCASRTACLLQCLLPRYRIHRLRHAS